MKFGKALKYTPAPQRQEIIQNRQKNVLKGTAAVLALGGIAGLGHFILNPGTPNKPATESILKQINEPTPGHDSVNQYEIQLKSIGDKHGEISQAVAAIAMGEGLDPSSTSVYGSLNTLSHELQNNLSNAPNGEVQGTTTLYVEATQPIVNPKALSEAAPEVVITKI